MWLGILAEGLGTRTASLPKRATGLRKGCMTDTLKIHAWPLLTRWMQGLSRRNPALPPNAELPARALQIWAERRDLQAAFDLKTTTGRTDMFWWCLVHGFREMGFRFDESLDSGFLVVTAPFPRLRQCSFLPLTWLMRALWASSAHRTPGLRSEEEQYNCLAHYFVHGLTEANLEAFLTKEQADVLRQPMPGDDFPRLFRLIWHCDPGLGRTFGAVPSEAFIAWCRSEEGVKAWPIIAHPLVGLAPPPRRKPRRGRVRGVNLFGHVLGRFGVGEDVRMAALALEAAAIPYVIRNVTAPAAGEEESPSGLRLADDLPHDVNLFCMTGMTTIAVAMSEGVGLHDGRHSIGVWHWELPEWPRFFDQAWEVVDEVWAPSRFTYDAYARSAHVPLYHMPVAVAADDTESAVRADFGLPSDAFLFGCAFDGLSSFARKNPLAIVEAFQRAFPAGEAHVGLVVKGIRADANMPALAALHAKIAADPRIHLFNASLTRGRLLDLYRSLDVFVSLHRSEGFGRNIAEAMLLGKPVIVSAHSGNMDFTTFQTAALVPTRLKAVQEGEYAFGAGQQWGDPDVDAAARAMERMVQDGAWRKSLARKGQKLIARDFSPEAVGAAWAKRLNELS